MLKKDKIVGCAGPGYTNRTDKNPNNNISYNNNNVIITILQHIQNPGIFCA